MSCSKKKLDSIKQCQRYITKKNQGGHFEVGDGVKMTLNLRATSSQSVWLAIHYV